MKKLSVFILMLIIIQSVCHSQPNETPKITFEGTTYYYVIHNQYFEGQAHWNRYSNRIKFSVTPQKNVTNFDKIQCKLVTKPEKFGESYGKIYILDIIDTENIDSRNPDSLQVNPENSFSIKCYPPDTKSYISESDIQGFLILFPNNYKIRFGYEVTSLEDKAVRGAKKYGKKLWDYIKE